MKCFNCGGELIADGKKDAMGNHHLKCSDCKRGFYSTKKYLNDGKNKILGEFSNGK